MRDDHEEERDEERAHNPDPDQNGDLEGRDGEDYDDLADQRGTSERGYGKPPVEHRFVKGRSGNPRGRPRGARGLKTDLKAELGSRVTITENGKKLKLTKQQVILKALVAKAAKGDTRAASQVLAMTMQMFGIEDERTGSAGLSAQEQAILESYLMGVGSNPGLVGTGADETPASPATGLQPDGDNNIGEGD